MTSSLRSIGRAVRRLALFTRRVISKIVRTAWKLLPISLAAKMFIKDRLFERMPLLFQHSYAYQIWKQTKKIFVPVHEFQPKGINSVIHNQKTKMPLFWGIMATSHTLFIAKSIENQLRRHGWNVDLMTNPPDEFFHDLYIVICPQIFEKLPPFEKMISFQMEQSISSRWFTDNYLDILSHSFSVLEYATHNFPFLKSKGIAYPHLYYLPVGGISGFGQVPKLSTKIIDVLFYGDSLSSPRRQRMLSALSSKFNIRIENDLFGSPMEQAIREARVVINLHYYENALLEVPRIWECLSLGTMVVSESAIDQNDYPELNGAVKFFKQGSIDSMICAIEEALGNLVSEKVISFSVEKSERKFSFMFDRFLIGMNILPCDYVRKIILNLSPNSSKIILSMPEAFDRRNTILKEQKLDDWSLFDGIRRQPGWVGCGLSYLALVDHAKRHNLNRLVVAEDDVLLTEDFLMHLETIYRFLDQRTDHWHIFSGLISDIHNDTRILQIDEFEGMTFATIDKMTSTVFNIYSQKFFDTFTAWDFNNLNPEENTIDRFIENQKNLRIIVAVPFLVGHREDVDSVLWGFNNITYSKMIARSEDKLKNMILAFRKSHP